MLNQAPSPWFAGEEGAPIHAPRSAPMPSARIACHLSNSATPERSLPIASPTNLNLGETYHAKPVQLRNHKVAGRQTNRNEPGTLLPGRDHAAQHAKASGHVDARARCHNRVGGRAPCGELREDRA